MTNITLTAEQITEIANQNFTVVLNGNIGKKAPQAGKAGNAYCTVARNSAARQADGTFADKAVAWYFVSAFECAPELLKAQPGQQVSIVATLKMADYIKAISEGRKNIPVTARKITLGLKSKERAEAPAEASVAEVAEAPKAKPVAKKTAHKKASHVA